MPIYEYKCDSGECGEKFEVMKPISKSKEKEKCPKCGSDSKRIFSVYSFKFSKMNFH